MRSNSKKKIVSFFAAVFLMFSFCVIAVEIDRKSLSDRVSRSELVVAIADVKVVPFDENEGENFFRASGRITKVLKGAMPAAATIEIRIDNTIPEEGNVCCEERGVYLAFLARNHKGEWAPVSAGGGLVNLLECAENRGQSEAPQFLGQWT